MDFSKDNGYFCQSKHRYCQIKPNEGQAVNIYLLAEISNLMTQFQIAVGCKAISSLPEFRQTTVPAYAQFTSCLLILLSIIDTLTANRKAV